MAAIFDEPYGYVSCTHCGAQCSCPKYVFHRYPGENVTRWCEKCKRLFDVQMPPRGSAGSTWGIGEDSRALA